MLETVNARQLHEFGQGGIPARGVRLDESLAIPAGERIAWERRLNRYRHSCGCAEGAAGLFVGLALVLAAYFLLHRPWTKPNVAAAASLPLALLACGKLIGRHLDRLRFRKACKQLLQRLAVST